MNVHNVLFFSSAGSDYLEEIVLAGLLSVMGPERITLCPPRLKYYFSRKAYPFSLGKCRPFPLYVPDILLGSLRKREFDCIIIGSLKPDVFERYLRMVDRLPRNLPVVLIDGGDREEIGGDADRLGFTPLFHRAANARPFDVIFKREYVQGKSYPANVYPLPMAFRSDITLEPARAKKYDVVFWGVESHPIRSAALAILQKSFDCADNGTVPKQQPRAYPRKGSTYFQELSAANICCNFRGAGWDTLRYWEIPAAASFMLSQRPRIVIPDNFADRKECVFCADDLHDLTDLAGYYLSHEREREEIAASGHAVLLKRHTHVRRAEYVLDTLRSAL